MLKGLTLRFGSLHEAQVQQLKMYPRLIQGISKATAHVDTAHKTVVFDCEAKGFRKTARRILEMTAITDYTRVLLWDDSVVVFKINGKQIYDSKFDYTAKETDGEHRNLSE